MLSKAAIGGARNYARNQSVLRASDRYATALLGQRGMKKPRSDGTMGSSTAKPRRLDGVAYYFSSSHLIKPGLVIAARTCLLSCDLFVFPQSFFRVSPTANASLTLVECLDSTGVDLYAQSFQSSGEEPTDQVNRTGVTDYGSQLWVMGQDNGSLAVTPH